MSPKVKSLVAVLAFAVPLFLVASALQAVSGNTLRPSGNLGAGSIFCTDPPIGLDNSTYVTYNTYGSADASVKWSVWYGTSATDPATFAAVIAVLLLVTLVAQGIPLLRAMRVDPAVALRQE